MELQNNLPPGAGIIHTASMRIAIISPFSRGPVRGNITTVNRISHYLGQLGVELRVLPADTLSITEMAEEIAAFVPDLIHGFHARYGGCPALHLAERLKIPFMLTLTGSDLHDPLLRTHPETTRALTAASAVVCFHESEADELTGHFSHLAKTTVVIAQGVERLPLADVPDNFGLTDNLFVLLLPTAIRPVKQIEFPLRALATLANYHPEIHLAVAGGVINADYAAAIRSQFSSAPYVTWLGEVPRERMGSLYSRADVVLNCSRFESMPNTLLEAMSLERPVLVADIPGNRTVVRHGDSGMLYYDQASFIDCVLKLKSDHTLRQELGHNAGDVMRDNFSPQREAESYLMLYNSLAT